MTPSEAWKAWIALSAPMQRALVCRVFDRTIDTSTDGTLGALVRRRYLQPDGMQPPTEQGRCLAEAIVFAAEEHDRDGIAKRWRHRLATARAARGRRRRSPTDSNTQERAWWTRKEFMHQALAKGDCLAAKVEAIMAKQQAVSWGGVTSSLTPRDVTILQHYRAELERRRARQNP